MGAAESSTAVTSAEEPAAEGSEGHEEGKAAEEEDAHADDTVAPHNEADETSETTLGVAPESTLAVVAAVVISLVLAAALWFWRTPVILIVAVVFALLFAALDLREVTHLLGEARNGLTAIAMLAAVLHLGVAVLAGLALSRPDASAGTPSLA